MRAWVWPFVFLAAAGLVASSVVHVAALFGVPVLGQRAWMLHMGIFVVWFPAILSGKAMTREVPQKDYWRAALRGCPSWMRCLFYALGAYAALNVVIFMGLTARTHGQDVPEVVTIRGFSGHWMAFYAAAMAMLFSHGRVGERDGLRRCMNGHHVSPLARYCEECGSPVVDTSLE